MMSCCTSYRPPLSSTSHSPVLVLLDTDKRDLECLLDFMYRGEALVSQERLQSFLNLAEKLQVAIEVCFTGVMIGCSALLPLPIVLYSYAQVAGLTQGKSETPATLSPKLKLQTQSSSSKSKLPPAPKPLKASAAIESGKCSKDVNNTDNVGVGEALQHSGDGVVVDKVKEEAAEAEDSSINYYSEYWTDTGTQEYYGKPR